MARGMGRKIYRGRRHGVPSEFRQSDGGTALLQQPRLLDHLLHGHAVVGHELVRVLDQLVAVAVHPGVILAAPTALALIPISIPASLLF